MSAPTLPRGAIVRHRLRDGLLGEVVRGPRRAARGMVFVRWEGSEQPVQMARLWVAYIARRGPVERVRAVLAALEQPRLMTATDEARFAAHGAPGDK
jgi:hypothetical protein